MDQLLSLFIHIFVCVWILASQPTVGQNFKIRAKRVMSIFILKLTSSKLQTLKGKNDRKQYLD